MSNESATLSYSVQVFAPEPDALIPLDTAAKMAGMPRHIVLVCCRRGLVAPHIDADYGGFYFDREAIRALQRIEYLRSACEVNFAGIEIIQQLMTEVQELRALL